MSIHAQGKVVSPQLREVMPGRPILRFALERMHEGRKSLLGCSAWGATAQAMLRDCPEDTMVFVTLRPQHRVTRVQGERHTLTDHLVQDYRVLTPKP